VHGPRDAGVAIAVLAAATATGCGSIDLRASGPATDSVQAAADRFFVEGGPDVRCGNGATPDLVRRVYGSVRACTAATAPLRLERPARADLRDVVIDGATAEAVVVLVGGTADRARGLARLVRDGHRWRVDGLSTQLLRSTLERWALNGIALRQTLPVRRCVRDAVHRLPASAVRALALGLERRSPLADRRQHTLVAACAAQRSAAGSRRAT
jgi:hypothetical protein